MVDILEDSCIQFMIIGNYIIHITFIMKMVMIMIMIIINMITIMVNSLVEMVKVSSPLVPVKLITSSGKVTLSYLMVIMMMMMRRRRRRMRRILLVA